MIKNSSLQKGNAQIIIIVILVVALLAALGFVLWQNLTQDDKDASKHTQTTQVASENEQKASDAVESTGIITGSLTYPSGYIPPNIVIHATNIDTGEEYTTTEHLSGDEYLYGTGYRLEVPVGRYNVYGTLADIPDFKAYYNEFVKCGIKVECTDKSNIEVLVEVDKDTPDVMVGDWWSTQ